MTKAGALLLFPGAGSSASHPSLVAIERAVAPLPTARADFPYRREGRRAPDRPPKLLACVLEEAALLAERAGVAPKAIVLGGRSMGGRICSMAVADGLFLSLDLSGPTDRVVGYRAKKNSLPVDLSRIRAYRWTDYWDPVFPEPGGRIVLEPEIFYLLLSAEGVCIPPQIAAEMMAYDPTAGELRTHYAGFFDPGFGYDPGGGRHGSRAALEVRARDVSFMVEHRQPVCKLGLEWMSKPAERLYGTDLGSYYQGQVTMLSKHFEEQTAGVAIPVDA